MKYEDIKPIRREDLQRALESNSETCAARAIIAVALYDPDWSWAEQQCLSVLKDSRKDVRAAAIIGLGHIARVHGKITPALVLPQLEALKSDPSVGGLVDDALEDILMFVNHQNPHRQ